MGQLALPASGKVYLDANCIIYTVEVVEPYKTVLQAVWEAARLGTLTIVTSELTLLEVLVKPLKIADKSMEDDFRALLLGASDVTMIAVTQAILERAALLRATVGLKTPDAIHAATALLSECALFVTNDPPFRRVSGLPVCLLGEALL